LEEKLSSDEKKLFSNLYREILNDLKDQPKVLCHFDFESRNLMVLPNGNAGVLDFQDAVFGPIFLDPVALFKDLYLNINDKEVGALLGEYISRSDEIGLDQELEIEDAIRSFDLTGLQRQLRILGTISRLHLRDNKSFRLPDLHKTLNFVVETCSKYEELNEVSSYLKKKIVPLLTHTLKKIL
jgi:aminoglycoside/choline kinase family phosphotransferase